MSNLQPNYKMVECEEQTAELYMAMAEMMGDDDGKTKVEQGTGDQLNVMQFTMAQKNTYEKQDQMNNFAINNFSFYFSSFYNNQISDMEINNVALNLMEMVGKNPTLEQQIEKEISNIFKNNPQIAIMEHHQLIKYLENGGIS